MLTFSLVSYTRYCAPCYDKIFEGTKSPFAGEGLCFNCANHTRTGIVGRFVLPEMDDFFVYTIFLGRGWYSIHNLQIELKGQ